MNMPWFLKYFVSLLFFISSLSQSSSLKLVVWIILPWVNLRSQQVLLDFYFLNFHYAWLLKWYYLFGMPICFMSHKCFHNFLQIVRLLSAHLAVTDFVNFVFFIPLFHLTTTSLYPCFFISILSYILYDYKSYLLWNFMYWF